MSGSLSFAQLRNLEEYLAGTSKGSTSPAMGAFGVTPHNTNNLVHQSRGLFIGGAGNLHVQMADGSDATFTGVVAGSMLSLAVLKVYSTGTTCTNITAVY